MIEIIKEHLEKFDFDVRKSRDARFMDQKVTPDVVCIIADCVVNYVADRDVAFTKDDIWNDEYFNTNVKDVFKKPDTQNKNTKLEYDKFTSQPLKTLAYAGVLSLQKIKNRNFYKVKNKQLLEFISIRERNAYIFLYNYFIKVLSDSNMLRFFDDFKLKCSSGKITNDDFKNLKTRFQKFIIGNTAINGKVEVNRFFPKILNVFSCQNNIQGTIKGRLSERPIYYDDLMYNRLNWRDIDKNKNISRNEAVSKSKTFTNYKNDAYSDYQVKKAMNIIRKMYSSSEIKDQWSNGEATQVHHIFPKSEFIELAYYLENLIKLTPTQHYTKAHPSNNTQNINPDYQMTCLLAKTDSIENSLLKGEFIYRKESLIYVINTGLSTTLNSNINFKEIKQELCIIYNRM